MLAQLPSVQEMQVKVIRIQPEVDEGCFDFYVAYGVGELCVDEFLCGALVSAGGVVVALDVNTHGSLYIISERKTTVISCLSNDFWLILLN
jgi:hypothetical protein